MLNEDRRQTLAEKWLLKGRRPQLTFVGDDDAEVGELKRSTAEWIWWKVLLHAQTGAEGDSPAAADSTADLRSQCFLLKTGMSWNAQYR